MLEILHGIVRHTLQIANSVEAFPSNFDPRKLSSSFLVNIQLKPKLTDNPKEFPRKKKKIIQTNLSSGYCALSNAIFFLDFHGHQI